jgi:hypothetical protein
MNILSLILGFILGVVTIGLIIIVIFLWIFFSYIKRPKIEDDKNNKGKVKSG